MKKLLALLLSLIMVVCCFTIGVSATATREVEDNGLAINANVITNSITGSLSGAADTDWYKFNSVKDYFVVDFGVNESFIGVDVKDGWKVYIYDQNMTELKSYAVEKGGFTTPRFSFGGIIYVKVVSGNSQNKNTPVDIDYDIKVTQTTNALWESEYNETIQTANSINCGSVYTGSIHRAGDTDYYKVNTIGDYAVVEFDISSEFLGVDVANGWSIYIYDKNMSTIGSFSDVKSKLTTPRYAFAGPIYIRVKSDSPSIGRFSPINIEYKLKVTTAKDAYWENEYNDTAKQAQSIKAGKVYKGNLYKGADADYYKLTAPASGTITVNFSRDLVTNDGDGYEVEVMNKSGLVIGRVYVKDIAKATLSNIKVAKGTNYIVITKGGYFIPSGTINYKISYTFKLAKPSIKKLTASKKAFKATWKRNKDVNGYEIQYSTKKSFKKAKIAKISKNKTVKKTVKKLKAKKTYYVRIRTFKKIDGKKVYSAWSKSKKIKTK